MQLMQIFLSLRNFNWKHRKLNTCQGGRCLLVFHHWKHFDSAIFPSLTHGFIIKLLIFFRIRSFHLRSSKALKQKQQIRVCFSLSQTRFVIFFLFKLQFHSLALSQPVNYLPRDKEARIDFARKNYCNNFCMFSGSTSAAKHVCLAFIQAH